MNNSTTTDSPVPAENIHTSARGLVGYAVMFILVLMMWVRYGPLPTQPVSPVPVSTLVATSVALFALAWLQIALTGMKEHAQRLQLANDQLKQVAIKHRQLMDVHPVLDHLLLEMCEATMPLSKRNSDGTIPAATFVTWKAGYVQRYTLSTIVEQYQLGTLPGLQDIKDRKVRSSILKSLQQAARM